MHQLRRSLTTRGAAFAGAGLVLVASGVLLGQHDVTRVGILLLALTVIALVLVRRHGLHLDVVRIATPSRVAIDERAVVTVRIRNVEPTPSPVVMAEESIDYALGDRPRFVLPSLRPGDVQEVQYTVRSHTRGVHRIGPLGVRVRDPFGLTLRTAAVSGDAEIVVLPKVVPLPHGRSLGSGIGSEGSIPHMVALHGEDDQTVREYRDGDDLRRIHWPATARTGELMVRQEDRPAKRRAVVVLDTRSVGHGGSGRSSSLEWCVTTAASVTAHVVDAGYAVHLLTADARADNGVHHDETLPEALESLARVGLGPEDGLRAVLHAANALTSQGGLVVYVGGPVGDDDARTLSALRQPGSAGAAMVVDPEAFAGRTRRGGGGRRPDRRDPGHPAVVGLDDDPGRRAHHAGARRGRPSSAARSWGPGEPGPARRGPARRARHARGHPAADHPVHPVDVVPPERAPRGGRRPGRDGPAAHHGQPTARRAGPGGAARQRGVAAARARAPLRRPAADAGDRPGLRGPAPGGPGDGHELHRAGAVQPRHDPGDQPADRPDRGGGRRDRRDVPQPGAGRHPAAVGVPRVGDQLR